MYFKPASYWKIGFSNKWMVTEWWNTLCIFSLTNDFKCDIYNTEGIWSHNWRERKRRANNLSKKNSVKKISWIDFQYTMCNRFYWYLLAMTCICQLYEYGPTKRLVLRHISPRHPFYRLYLYTRMNELTRQEVRHIDLIYWHKFRMICIIHKSWSHKWDM